MPITTVSAVQMRCVEDPTENLAHAESLVRQAATKGAQIILIGIDARAILLGGGNIHCITQQVPATDKHGGMSAL